MRRIEGDPFAQVETVLFKHGRGRDARVAGGKDRPSAGKGYAVRARQMKPVKTDGEKEIEHHLAAAHGDGAARREQPARDIGPTRAPGVPPPAVQALLEPRRLTGNDKTRTPPDVGLGFVAATREYDEVRKILRALVKLPVLFVAQRNRRQSVGAGDLVVVRDDGVAADVKTRRHFRMGSPEIAAVENERSRANPQIYVRLVDMISLPEDVETLARRVAAVERTSVEDAIRRALEDRARAKGVSLVARRGRRMTAEQMLALGVEIAAMPLLDSRSPREIMDDLSAL